jgi:zinc transporter
MIDAPNASLSPEHVNGVLWAFRFRADGSSEKLDLPLLRSEVERVDGWMWLHFSISDQNARKFIQHFDGLPKPAIDTLLSDDEHNRISISDSSFHGVFADLQRDLSGKTTEIGKLHFALSDRIVISMRRGYLHSADSVRTKIEAGKSIHLPISLLEEIVSQFSDAVQSVITETSESLDEIEDRIIEKLSKDDSASIIPIRRLAMRIHRQLLSLRNLFHRLEQIEEDDAHPNGVIGFAARLAQRLDALDHEAAILQDRARLLQDEMDAKTNTAINAHLHLLSILTALMLPPTLVAGIFGMNVKDLPLLETENGFWFAMSLAALTSLGAYYLMRRLDIA